ncbi:hypothetical protein OC846_003575 [Tilletia horrida]|uniref:F-box domain-containing protein n=1 Tax=Tilletia horrida TaxID=155126 RepID=A0AAN6JTT6_9BASI|nr:hypothetical protein OC846_003575 [Tilletia horrida]
MGYAKLPLELVALVLEFACAGPSSTPAGHHTLPTRGSRLGNGDEDEDEEEHDQLEAGRAPAHLRFTSPAYLLESTVFEPRPEYHLAHHVDLYTAQNAVLVCKEWHHLITPHLYRAVQLHTPIKLQQFARTLRNRPELGSHLRHLFVGHLTPAPAFPVRPHPNESAVHPHRSFGFEDADIFEEFRTKLVEECQTCGLDGTGVHPIIKCYNARTEHIGLDEWVQRIYEVERNCILPPERTHSATSERTSNHFLHPLLFSRSRAAYLLTGHPAPSYSFPIVDDLPGPDEDDAHAAGPSTIWQNVRPAEDPYPPPEDVERLAKELESLNTHAELHPEDPSIQALSRDAVAILRRAPRIESVSLNGCFERTITSSTVSFKDTFENLKSISLGPPPLYWEAELNFGGSDHPVFANITELAVYGCLFFRSEALTLAGANGALPKLEKLRWCFTLEPDDITPAPGLDSLAHTIQVLLGMENEADTSQEEQEEAHLRSQLSLTQNSSVQALQQAMREPMPQRVRRGVRFLHCTFAPGLVRNFREEASEELQRDPRLTIETAGSEDQMEDVYRAVTRWRSVAAGERADARGRRADHGMFLLDQGKQ